MFQLQIIANKEVDGGYKLHTTMNEDSFCNTVVKYAGDNWPLILAKAKVDPPECPIPPVTIIIISEKNFIHF